MSTLGKAVMEFSADTAKFDSDVGRTALMFQRNMTQMQNGLESLRNAFIGVAAVTGIGSMVKGAIDAGDELNKMSQKVGISVERLSELKFGAQLADLDVQSLGVGLKGFNKSLVEALDTTSKAAGIFNALGVDITQGPDVALRQFAEALSKMADGELKTTLATEVLGKAGMNMIPWLNQGGAGMDRMSEQARNLGLTMSKETAEQAEVLNDNLKILGTRAEATGIIILTKLAGPLVTLTGNLIQASEQGNLFWQSMVEGTKLFAATMAGTLGKIPNWMPGPFGLIGKGAREMADSIFEADERMKSLRNGAKINLNPGITAGDPGGGNTNPEALSCALSGGKWVGGRCVRAGAGAGGGKEKRFTDAEVARHQLEDLTRLEREQGELNEYITKTQIADLKLLEEGRALENKQVRDNIDAEREAADEMERNASRIGEAAAKTNDIARELGLTFSSAFEDAIVGGKNFSEVLKGVEKDLVRLITRKSITEPAGKAMSGFLDGIDWGSLFGGGGGATQLSGPSMPSYAEGTDYVPHDMVAQIHQGEKIIPAAQNNGAQGGVTVVQNINIDARSDAASIMLAMGRAKEMAKAEILDSMARGGSFAR